MQTRFKRHQKVKILFSPSIEDIEPYSENLENQDNLKDVEIKPGMSGKINIILPNGKYHVEILNEKEETIAYAVFDEEALEEE